MPARVTAMRGGSSVRFFSGCGPQRLPRKAARPARPAPRNAREATTEWRRRAGKPGDMPRRSSLQAPRARLEVGFAAESRFYLQLEAEQSLDLLDRGLT